MYLSINWLKELIDIDYSLEELDHVLTIAGIEVEGIIDYSKKYEKFFIGKVLTKEKHPDADKLSVCTVEADEVRTVVCGAPNVEAGQTVILGTTGATVPAGGFKLSKRAVRGIESDGMICSETELELGEDGSGIMVLPEGPKPGTPLADHLEMNDTILDISITPNRPDWLSHIGVAREISAYNGNPVKIPGSDIKEDGGNINESCKITIEDTEKCPRYAARTIRNIKVQESPDWLKNRLVLLGQRPVNNIVDVTNFVLLEMGQPLHAFDLNRLEGNEIIVKTAEDKEKFTTLDSKERELDSEMLMICDAERSVAIGGVMGGENSEISDASTDVLLESAYFLPASVRRTSKKLTIQSEASYRFERGVDPNNILNALDRAAQLIAEVSGGYVEQGVIDVYPQKITNKPVKLRYEKANNLIGVDLTPAQIKESLTNLGMEITEDDDESATFIAPTYRVDVEIEEDLIEEIARIYGFDNIPVDITSPISLGAGTIPGKLAIPEIRNMVNEYMIKNGFNQIITQNQMDPKSASIYTEDPVRISNPLGEELSLMRPSLIPSMLKTIEKNLRLGNTDLKVFEIGRAFNKIKYEGENFVDGIEEKEFLIVALSGSVYQRQWGYADRKYDFYDIKGIVEDLCSFLGLSTTKYKQFNDPFGAFSPNTVQLLQGKKALGRLGEIDEEMLKKFDIETTVILAEIDLDSVYKAKFDTKYYDAVPPYPGMSRDLAFIVSQEAPAEAMRNLIIQNGGKFLRDVSIFDVYSGKGIDKGMKSIAFALSFSSPERTLREEEVAEATSKIVAALEKKYEAKLRN
jgi:phenylalanyl-tRNA synthetase beta chain